MRSPWNAHNYAHRPLLPDLTPSLALRPLTLHPQKWVLSRMFCLTTLIPFTHVCLPKQLIIYLCIFRILLQMVPQHIIDNFLFSSLSTILVRLLHCCVKLWLIHPNSCVVFHLFSLMVDVKGFRPFIRLSNTFYIVFWTSKCSVRCCF